MAQTIKTGYLIAEKEPFSQSLIWELQQHYFAAMGVEAWRQGEVPHYISSNPRVANTYAEMVIAFWRDQQRLAPKGTLEEAPNEAPLYIIELGAGAGRLAFHFLKRLTHLCRLESIPPTAFCYVLTDLPERNLDFWQQHPRFQFYFEQGILDLALFDITQSTDFHLLGHDQIITSASLKRPPVVIANYVFDSVPQNLFYFHDQQCYQCLISLFTEKDPATLLPAQLLAQLYCTYDYHALSVPPYPEIYLQDLLTKYQHNLSNTHLLLPITAIRCLQWLKTLSSQGLLLLSADKGSPHLSALEKRKPPSLVRHGSFSLTVNYHALKTFCEYNGGIALFPEHQAKNLTMSALLLLNQAEQYIQTQRAYQRHIQEFSPDDFYSITKHARQYILGMTPEDILAYIRLSLYDAHQFARYLPRLMELIPNLTQQERDAISQTVDKVWDLYFSLGEDLDLAHKMACLLYEMDNYAQAITYFEYSTAIYGQDTGTLYNMAVCYQFLGQLQQSKTLLARVLEYDPDNEQARDLLKTVNNEMNSE